MSELRAAQLRGALALAGREVRRVLSLWTQTILPAVLTGLLFLVVFGGALGDRIDRIGGVPYLDFILPGLLVLTVAGQSFSNNSTSVYQAKNEGYIEDVLSSPIPPRLLLLAYMSGGLVRAGAGALVLGLVASVWAGRPVNLLVLVLALVLTALLFSALGVLTGVWADTFDQHSFVAGIVITPLSLVGGVFYSVESLDSPWRELARLDPLYYLVDAARSGSTGSSESATSVSLLVAALAAALLFAGTAALIERGWRLRP